MNDQQVQAVATEAIFVKQLNTQSAVTYIQRIANVDRKTAGEAIKSVILSYRK